MSSELMFVTGPVVGGILMHFPRPWSTPLMIILVIMWWAETSELLAKMAATVGMMLMNFMIA